LLSIFSNDARARTKFLKNLSIATGVAGNPERKLISCTTDNEERREKREEMRKTREGKRKEKRGEGR
jgi:hypothetical protein